MPQLNIRCTEAQMIDLEIRSGGNKSDYVRRKLFEENDTQERLIHRLDDVLDLMGKQTSGGQNDNTFLESMMVEMLLLMRGMITNKGTKDMAQNEVERLGYQVFSSSKKLGG